MIRDEYDRVTDYFAARTSDLTPASSRRAARVLFAPVSRDPEVSTLCASVLSRAERRRADRFAAEEDRGLFEQRRAFRRFCGSRALGSSQTLSEIRFVETENGRPYLADATDLWFSFSCCNVGMLGAWSSTHGIGIDIEDPNRPLEASELARRFFSVAESEVVERLDGAERRQTFFRFWTLKEAALKSVGEGLPYGLDAFEFKLDPEPCISRAPSEYGGPAEFRAFSIERTDACAALLVRRLVRSPE